MLADAASQLCWLCPCASSLAALARAPGAAPWDEVRLDPGCVLLLLRYGPAAVTSFSPALPHDAAVLDAAARLVADGANGFVDWEAPAARATYHASLTYAGAAELLARETGGCDPHLAWAGALLAPLGWLALCAAATGRAEAVQPAPQPAAPDAGGIARRLNRRWQLPAWLAAVTGHLGLPAEIAVRLGADPGLFLVVQLAVALVEAEGAGLGLSVEGTPERLAADIALTPSRLCEIKNALAAHRGRPRAPRQWVAPGGVPLLADLLRLAAENRRLAAVPALEALQRQVDTLHDALERHRAEEGERLQRLKLAAIAELAAGAGHEINNPLAVISGQAQYLLGHETEPGRRVSLQKIIGQANRIHVTLRELMQFARPAPPDRQMVDVGRLIREVTASLQDLAVQRQVRLSGPEPPTPLTLLADPAQAHAALASLLRNAIEAAPRDGWAAIRWQPGGTEFLDLVVEDNGPGPSPTERQHLFDPFFSGRKAGRGRGLGLPTAWRLAREHGGDVRFDGAAGELTRFVLTLPLYPGSAPPAAGPAPPPPRGPDPTAAGRDGNGVNGCRVSSPAAS